MFRWTVSGFPVKTPPPSPGPSKEEVRFVEIPAVESGLHPSWRRVANCSGANPVANARLACKNRGPRYADPAAGRFHAEELAEATGSTISSGHARQYRDQERWEKPTEGAFYTRNHSKSSFNPPLPESLRRGIVRFPMGKRLLFQSRR
jgi:hypothetical protein